jgi:hypothetical protein
LHHSCALRPPPSPPTLKIVTARRRPNDATVTAKLTEENPQLTRLPKAFHKKTPEKPKSTPRNGPLWEYQPSHHNILLFYT